MITHTAWTFFFITFIYFFMATRSTVTVQVISHTYQIIQQLLNHGKNIEFEIFLNMPTNFKTSLISRIFLLLEVVN